MEELLIQGFESIPSPVFQRVTLRKMMNVNERLNIVSSRPYGLTDGTKIPTGRFEAFWGIVNQTFRQCNGRCSLKHVSYRHFPHCLWKQKTNSTPRKQLFKPPFKQGTQPASTRFCHVCWQLLSVETQMMVVDVFLISKILA